MKNRRKRIPENCLFLSAIVLSVLLWQNASGEQGENLFNPPLYLIYDVTYAGGRIAEVDFTESKPYIYKGLKVREIECRIESSGLFNLNGIYRSVVTDDYSVVYLKSDEGKAGNKRIIEYHFDYQDRSATITDRRIKGPDTLLATSRIENIDKRYFDSVSMIFKIRQGVDTLRASSYIPLFIEGHKDSVLIESVSEVRHAGRDSAMVDAYLIKARLPRSPYPGFGDRIEIYISRDEDRIPLRGRIEMALGYMEINLRRQ